MNLRVKMKKILGIISSARKLGNCEIMVKEICRNIPEPCEIQLLRLPDFNIKPCIGCYVCLFKDGGCAIEDDLYKIVQPMIEADALVVAAPAYFLGAHSYLKRLLDRGLSFYAWIEKLWGKPSVGVAVAGLEGREGSSLLGIENFLKLTLTNIKQTQVVYGALPGEVFLNPENRETAKKLGESLFGAPVPKKAPTCPLCGGDTFRFLEGNSVRCMLCSNPGTIEFKKGIPHFAIEKTHHQLFLSKQDAIDHKKWLIGMKERFILKRMELKEITTGYRKEGQWIKP